MCLVSVIAGMLALRQPPHVHTDGELAAWGPSGMTDEPQSGQERARRSLAAMREAAAPRIRVLIADDHAVLRQALRLLLEMHDEVEVVGDAADGRGAVDAAERLKPDVVLMDLVMPGLNGIDATRQLTQRIRGIKVIILTGYVDDDRLVDALRAGASGFVIKRSDVQELLLAIQAVSRGNPYISSALADGRSPIELLMAARSSDETSEDRLSTREREILQLVAEGHPNQGIADRLFLLRGGRVEEVSTSGLPSPNGIVPARTL